MKTNTREGMKKNRRAKPATTKAAPVAATVAAAPSKPPDPSIDAGLAAHVVAALREAREVTGATPAAPNILFATNEDVDGDAFVRDAMRDTRDLVPRPTESDVRKYMKQLRGPRRARPAPDVSAAAWALADQHAASPNERVFLATRYENLACLGPAPEWHARLRWWFEHQTKERLREMPALEAEDLAERTAECEALARRVDAVGMEAIADVIARLGPVSRLAPRAAATPDGVVCALVTLDSEGASWSRFLDKAVTATVPGFASGGTSVVVRAAVLTVPQAAVVAGHRALREVLARCAELLPHASVTLVIWREAFAVVPVRRPSGRQRGGSMAKGPRGHDVQIAEAAWHRARLGRVEVKRAPLGDLPYVDAGHGGAIFINDESPPWRSEAVRSVMDRAGEVLAGLPSGFTHTADVLRAFILASRPAAITADVVALARAAAAALAVFTDATSAEGLARAERYARLVRDLYGIASAAARIERPSGAGGVTLRAHLRVIH